MKPVINWDLDGVLAAFELHVEEVSGVPFAEIISGGDKRLWGTLVNHQRFFRNIPPCENMLNYAKQLKQMHDTRVITGRPRRDTMPYAEIDKRNWVREHMGDDIEVIVCLARDKHLHIGNSTKIHILVDDRQDNINRWNDAGGVGIFHQTYEETASKLNKLLGY